MSREPISTSKAPDAIGSYSQAVRAGNTVYLSGQIPLKPGTKDLAGDDIRQQLHQVFINLAAVAGAAGGSMDNIVKLTVYLTDMANFPAVNEIMPDYFSPPYPARAAVGVSQLPMNALVEIEGILQLED